MKWLNVDLPNLTSINSGGASFYHPRSLTLESISEYWTWSYLDIPNLQNVNLPTKDGYSPFKNVQSKTIKSGDWLTWFDSFIDVSSKLTDLIK